MGIALSEVILLHPYIGQTLVVLAYEGQRLKETSNSRALNQYTDGVSEHPGVGCKSVYMYFFLEAWSLAFHILNSPKEFRAITFSDRNLNMLIPTPSLYKETLSN